MNEAEIRSAFEEWAGRMGYSCEYEGPPDEAEYVDNDTWKLWGCWQAAIAKALGRSA